MKKFQAGVSNPEGTYMQNSAWLKGELPGDLTQYWQWIKYEMNGFEGYKGTLLVDQSGRRMIVGPFCVYLDSDDVMQLTICGPWAGYHPAAYLEYCRENEYDEDGQLVIELSNQIHDLEIEVAFQEVIDWYLDRQYLRH